MSTSASGTGRGAEAADLRSLAAAYEQAQRVRVELGERIRAAARDGAGLLERIRAGATDGPAPLLGRTYRRHWEQERELARGMAEALDAHPAWRWLRGVHGVGPTLGCRLLARLDLDRARNPSAFWAYCGLATVPGVEYRCDACGLVRSFPAEQDVAGPHRRRGDGSACTGRLVPTGGSGGVRVAQPRTRPGERGAYDGEAKRICYLIGASFLQTDGPYRDYYDAERERLARAQPAWSPARQHLTALRKTEKRFLRDLWVEWRSALGLPASAPAEPA
ncbi:MAG TPA: transposase [Longimicrobiales bacterium]|nr:transposase [Longimicrobiales bacterium]